MQTGLTATDRKLMGIAGGALAALTLATIFLAPVPETELSSVPSSYLSTPGGARAAYLLLQRMGTDVQRWQEPPFRLAEAPSGATLIIAEPTVMPSHTERLALSQFVQNGGRVLFCGADLPSFLPRVQLQNLRPSLPAPLENPEPVLSRVEQYRPVLEDAHAQVVELRADAVWQKLGPSQLPVYGAPNNAVVVTWALGEGEVIWWAAATPLTNVGLERSGNLQLFLKSVGVGSGRNVYWDEYFHGERGSLWDYIGRVTVVRWAAVQFALLALALLFTLGRRSGPIIGRPPTSRLSPLEFVETLGNLYRRAKAAPLAVEVSLHQLRLQLTRRLGLPATISDRDLAREAAERLGWNQEELYKILDQARAGAAANAFKSSSALEVVRKLQRFTARLGDLSTAQPQLTVASASLQEKHS